jgi:uncharacterized membrane protein
VNTVFLYLYTSFANDLHHVFSSKRCAGLSKKLMVKKAMKKIILLASVFAYLFGPLAFANHHIPSIRVKELSMNGQESILEFQNTKKASVVIFISKDCPCSKGNLSYINKLAEEFKDFNFIGIHSKKNASDKELMAYIADKNLSFKTYNDPDLKIADDFKALKTPHAFIVNTDGEVIYSGGVTSSTFPENAKSFYLKDALNEFLKTKKISNFETKTLGCYIAR